ncbi:MAG: radical SAM protein, partial [Nitrospinaceae bacterium]|nr:radical SAM protein [Nitrospinaceae bacterium]NIR56671.1 radical SAM protein [Nitrospinaceae bacterium]NIS87134.1 radical SAM protein [Nitrospinaceae bacterium]NIT83988.1 radical SAM protein [Nitrospinaceae bacterium]NIU46178.1 radical SAM protein [Nitrospinaceae bacterium]
KAFLAQNGIHDVVQRDLAIELLDDLCCWEKTKPLFQRIRQEIRELSGKANPTKFDREKFSKL